ncbi:MAG: MFS transporter [Deltaproteobacteria bacterium]|nr:MFS transporter [Deltaproteobacteria bacterium]
MGFKAAGRFEEAHRLSDPPSRFSAKKRRPFFYGWIVIAVGFVTLSIAFGIWYSYSVFFLSIVSEFGWDRAAASSIFSIFLVCHALMGLLTGFLQDRYGPRLVIPVGAFILGGALILTSRAHNLWQFYLTYGVLAGASVSLLGFTSHSAFLPNWFERKRGLAVGIATAGIGFGMLVIVPLVEKAIGRFGWRSTYILLAALVILVAAPLNALLSRRNPADLDLKPDGDPAGKRVDQPHHFMVMKIIDADWANREWTWLKALQTRRFWFMVLAFFCLSYAYQGTLLHSVSSMVDAGLTRQKAAACFGVLGILGSIGKILFGSLSDRFGRERANTVGITAAAVGIVCLINTTTPDSVLPLVFATLFGLGYGAAAPMMPSVSADIFLGRSFGLIFGMISMGSGAGGALGSFLTGALRDASGDYTLPLSLCTLSLACSCLFVWLAGPRKVRRMVKNDKH